MLEIIFFFLCSLAISGELALIALWYYGGIHTTKKTFPTYTPTVTIIVPCKGITKFFEENIQAICAQNYPQYKVLFIVDSYDDPAYQIIATVHHKNPHIAVHQTIPRETCSGKIAAQLTGISMAPASEVYVFADSDIRPHNTWLYHLVQPLQNNEIGATTGYRWYIPILKTSYLISTWNMVFMVGLYYRVTNYTWGGSTAIKKTTFEQLNIADIWKNGLSDDLLLTEELKKRVSDFFVPQSIVTTSTDETVGHFFKWGKSTNDLDAMVLSILMVFLFYDVYWITTSQSSWSFLYTYRLATFRHPLPFTDFFSMYLWICRIQNDTEINAVSQTSIQISIDTNPSHPCRFCAHYHQHGSIKYQKYDNLVWKNLY